MTLRTRAAQLALIQRNAEACAEAVRPQCTCQCHGSLHGQPHSADWIAETAKEEYEKQFRFIKPEYRALYEEEDSQ